MAAKPEVLCSLNQHRPSSGTKWPVHLHMTYPRGASILPIVERGLTAVGAVYELVHDDHVPRADLLTQGAASGRHDDVGAALQAQGLNVGPVVDLGGHYVVPATMSRGKKLYSKTC